MFRKRTEGLFVRLRPNEKPSRFFQGTRFDALSDWDSKMIEALFLPVRGRKSASGTNMVDETPRKPRS